MSNGHDDPDRHDVPPGGMAPDAPPPSAPPPSHPLSSEPRPDETHQLDPPPVAPPAAPPVYTPDQVIVQKTGNGLAVAALVLGLLGLLISWIPFLFFLWGLFGVLAIIFGAIAASISRKEPMRGGKGMAITGLVTGILTLVFGAVIFAGMVAFFSDAGQDLQSELEELESELGTLTEQ